MRVRFAILLLASPVLLFPACGPDPKPSAPCDGPDFDVLISSLEGPLPADTVVVLTYGSGTEQYALSDPSTPEVLFCTPLDSEGQPLEAGAPTAAQGGAASDGGLAGAGGSAGSGSLDVVGSLRCTLWTQGPATLEVTASGYPDLKQELKLQRGTCTVEKSIELAPEDGGA